MGDAFINHHLHGAHDALVFALSKHNTTRRLAGRVEDRLHHRAGVIHKLRQLLFVSVKILDRTCGDARVHRGFGNRWRDAHNQARIERFRDQIFWPERERTAVAIRRRHLIVLLGHREICDGFDCRDFHRFVHRRRAHIKRATEDEREAENVVHLIGIIAATGGDDGVWARCLRDVRHDFRIRISQRQNQRAPRHFREPFRFQHACGGEAKEHVGPVQQLIHRA